METGLFLLGRSGRLLQVIRRKTSKKDVCMLFWMVWFFFCLRSCGCPCMRARDYTGIREFGANK